MVSAPTSAHDARLQERLRSGSHSMASLLSGQAPPENAIFESAARMSPSLSRASCSGFSATTASRTTISSCTFFRRIRSIAARSRIARNSAGQAFRAGRRSWSSGIPIRASRRSPRSMPSRSLPAGTQGLASGTAHRPPGCAIRFAAGATSLLGGFVAGPLHRANVVSVAWQAPALA
jgi:hypothetical protein